MLTQCSLTGIALLIITTAAATQSQTWQFDVTTQGEDVFWTSPTAVDPNAAEYHGAYVITLIEVGASWNGVPVGTFDVTDEVPEEDREGEETVDGPAPILLLDDQLVFPEPPEDPTIAATVRVELTAGGFGQVSITDVTLGTAVIDLGGFIGEQEVQITSVRVAGTLDVEPITIVGDLNGDGVVNVSDLLILLANWGPCSGDCPADLNDDGVVDVSDMLILLSNWG